MIDNKGTRYYWRLYVEIDDGGGWYEPSDLYPREPTKEETEKITKKILKELKRTKFWRGDGHKITKVHWIKMKVKSDV